MFTLKKDGELSGGKWCVSDRKIVILLEEINNFEHSFYQENRKTL